MFAFKLQSLVACLLYLVPTAHTSTSVHRCQSNPTIAYCHSSPRFVCTWKTVRLAGIPLLLGCRSETVCPMLVPLRPTALHPLH